MQRASQVLRIGVVGRVLQGSWGVHESLNMKDATVEEWVLNLRKMVQEYIWPFREEAWRGFVSRIA